MIALFTMLLINAITKIEREKRDEEGWIHIFSSISFFRWIILP